MVLVLMGEQDRIERGHLRTEHLLPEIGTGVDHEGPRTLRSVLPIDLEQGAGSGAVVAGVGGRAHPAVTGDDRDPLGGSGAEKGEVNAHGGQS